jgi:hypothetical protein
MDSLHTVLRSIRETKSRRHHLNVFREFLSHLDRIGRRAVRPREAKTKVVKLNGRRGK